MKTVEELFKEFSVWDDGYEQMCEDEFVKALTEHDNEIKELIDEMIEDSGGRTDIEYDEYIGYKQALTELKEKIQSTN